MTPFVMSAKKFWGDKLNKKVILKKIACWTLSHIRMTQ